MGQSGNILLAPTPPGFPVLSEAGASFFFSRPWRLEQGLQC